MDDSSEGGKDHVPLVALAWQGPLPPVPPVPSNNNKVAPHPITKQREVELAGRKGVIVKKHQVKRMKKVHLLMVDPEREDLSFQDNQKIIAYNKQHETAIASFQACLFAAYDAEVAARMIKECRNTCT
jgi:hypothetical protein